MACQREDCANPRMPTTICAGPTNSPTTGLRYRVAISAERLLDSALIERTFENMTIPTGATPSSSVPPFTLMRCSCEPEETRMDNTTMTRMRNSPNYARVKADVVLPINLDFMDSDGIAVHTHTNYTFSEDIVLYVPNDTNGAVFPYDITAEATVLGTEGVGNRNTTTINKFCVRIVTRVRAETDLLIPAYGFAPIEPATVYGSETCREFFAQPLFPNGKARTVCRQE